MALVSIVVPCFEESAVIEATVDALLRFCDAQPAHEFELIFVDDGSRDDTARKITGRAGTDSRVKLLRLSRNFGHQAAVTAGIDAAGGDAVAVIDADLQDPPAAIGDMIAAWERGHEVVYGVRSSRAGESRFKKVTAALFYRGLRRMSDVDIPVDTGDFRLMDRAVVEVLKEMPERHRFLRGLVSWIGFDQVPLRYDREPRMAGTTKYPLRKMVRFASDGLVSFSTAPLRVATQIGLVSSGIALAGIVYALAVRLFTSQWVQGWTAIFIAVLFVGGVQLVCLGIIGSYVGRIFEETKRRPLYVVRSRLGFDAAERNERHPPVSTVR
jgi:dolichol-phosphate mannosyltransferase